MTDKKEVEIKWLREEVLPKVLKKGNLVKNFQDDKENTFKIHDLTVNFIGPEESFMLTICYRVKLEFEYASEKYSRNFVLKKTPPLEKIIYDSIGFKLLFGNEIHTYKNLLPAMEAFSGEPFSGPKLRYSELRENFAAIMLDDFGVEGWRVPKLRYNLSLEHALMAVKYLGEFHGIGFAWKQINPEDVAKIVSELKESRFHESKVHPGWKLLVETSVKRIITMTQKHAKEVSQDELNTLEKIIADYFTMGKHWVQPREPMTTICHGDYLRNNIAYKYADKEAEKPIDVMMFDMQTVRFCSPMVDLSLFLHLSTLADTRQNNFEKIFDTYANALATKFTALTKDPLPEFLCKENLLKEYVRFMPYGIACCGSFLFMLVDPSSQPDLNIIDEEKIINLAMTSGGEICDNELVAQVKEFFELAQNNNIEVSKIFNFLS